MTPSEVQLRDLVERAYRFALALTHDAAQAEDICQEAWQSVLQARGPWTAPYVLTAVRRKFVDAWRREAPGAFALLDDALPAAAAAPEAAERWDDEPILLRNGALEGALAQLRPEERAVLYLSAVENYTARQIADLFGWPRGTVLSLVHRARQKVRRRLEDSK
jgi:RNA polymerase sigma-70 factor (ECF subfamily)